MYQALLALYNNAATEPIEGKRITRGFDTIEEFVMALTVANSGWAPVLNVYTDIVAMDCSLTHQDMEELAEETAEAQMREVLTGFNLDGSFGVGISRLLIDPVKRTLTAWVVGGGRCSPSRQATSLAYRLGYDYEAVQSMGFKELEVIHCPEVISRQGDLKRK